MRPVDIPEGGELPLVLPPAAYAYDFVLAHSMPEDEPELVTGLYCYAEMVIQQVGWAAAMTMYLSLAHGLFRPGSSSCSMLQPVLSMHLYQRCQLLTACLGAVVGF
jgi:hypothetical protein